ncbi:MAG: GTP pyrophosphokinase family protein [Clostridia bacterium]|nr:GTP pyrophosphokinase family protein [Clostridia bacterium]
MNKNTDLQKIENFLEAEKNIEINSKDFEKLMFIYKVAIKEMQSKLEILKDEFKMFYEYDLVDHINTRIKSPQSILKKMNDKGLKYTYKDMIENINDIAGIRVICPVKKDIYSVRNLVANLPGVKVLKEKDYVRNPKKSGYSSYHMIIEVPITLSQSLIYVKVEVQIRTLAMDFWASLEHKIKYKSDKEITKATSKELIQCAKLINKLDNKMMLLNN